MRLYLACDQSVDWDPHDPRVDRLIDDLESWEIEHEGNSSRPENPTPVFSLILRESPAWRRIVDTLVHRAERRWQVARLTPRTGLRSSLNPDTVSGVLSTYLGAT